MPFVSRAEREALREKHQKALAEGLMYHPPLKRFVPLTDIKLGCEWRMARIDALPANERKLVHEYGLKMLERAKELKAKAKGPHAKHSLETIMFQMLLEAELKKKEL